MRHSTRTVLVSQSNHVHQKNGDITKAEPEKTMEPIVRCSGHGYNTDRVLNEGVKIDETAKTMLSNSDLMKRPGCP